MQLLSFKTTVLLAVLAVQCFLNSIAAAVPLDGLAAGSETDAANPSDLDGNQESGDATTSDDLELLAAYLEQILRNDQDPGLVYVGDDNGEEPTWVGKRSRYYRRYPWKRQNSRHHYEDVNSYMCNPTREDVFQLLVALHEAREGNTRRIVNFCNRRRPASAIFTNIRFLGRK